MKPVRWTAHALKSLADRGIDRDMAERTVAQPQLVAAGQPPRQLRMGRYFDTELQQEMLLCAVTEETPEEIVVVTVFRTSQIARYLKGVEP
jgi:Domain of unknown function (DUF4258)